MPDKFVWEKFLENGSLLYVTGELNDELHHMVEASKTGERISLVFRLITPKPREQLLKNWQLVPPFPTDPTKMKKTNSLNMPELARTRGVDDDEVEEGDDDSDNDEMPDDAGDSDDPTLASHAIDALADVSSREKMGRI